MGDVAFEPREPVFTRPYGPCTYGEPIPNPDFTAPPSTQGGGLLLIPLVIDVDTDAVDECPELIPALLLFDEELSPLIMSPQPQRFPMRSTARLARPAAEGPSPLNVGCRLCEEFGGIAGAGGMPDESGMPAGDPGIAVNFCSLFGKVGKKAWILPLMLDVVDGCCA